MAGYIGQQFGNYRLLHLIGHGGFADVYLGEHIYMGTQAAIKVLHAQLGSKEVERFRQEASMVARLEHPHIVRVLDFGVEEAMPYLVLSYAPNGTLRDRYPKGTALPLPTIVEYIRQLANALQYAHNEKIIHRDIKPENMLVGKRNEILLSDFGIALISQNSRSGNMKDLAGTAAYMAPEQIEGYPRAASDQYALGIVAYEWLCGSCPFQGTFTETALQHAVTPPPLLHEKVPNISPAIEQVVLTALAKDPTERFASVQGFARAFEQASQTTIAPPVILQKSTNIDSGELPTIIAARTPVFLPSGAKLPPGSPMVQAPDDLPLADTPATMKPISHTPVNWVAAVRETKPVSDVQQIESMTPPSQDVALLDMPPRLRKSLRVRDVLLILLALIVVGGGVFGGIYFSSKLHKNQPALTSQELQTAIVTMQAQHRQAVNAYNQNIDKNGGMFGFNAKHTRFNPYETILGTEQATAVQAWIAPTGAAIGLSSAIVVDGVVYIGSQNGKLYAFDAISGRQKWVAETQGPIDSSPAVANGLVFVGSENHTLYAFYTQTGKRKWSYTTGGPIASSPMLAFGILYIGSEDAKLYAIDQNTGQLQWAKSVDGSGIDSSPAWSNGDVYVGSLSGNVYALEAKTGKRVWVYPTGGPIYSSPALANEWVYIGSGDHKLYALDERTGRKIWAQPTTGAIFASPAIAYGSVYISAQSGLLYAFNALTGEPAWESSQLGAFDSSPFVANGLVYLGTKANTVVAIDAQTGQKTESFATKSPVNASPIVVNGIIYAGAVDGNIYAFHLA